MLKIISIAIKELKRKQVEHYILCKSYKSDAREQQYRRIMSARILLFVGFVRYL